MKAGDEFTCPYCHNTTFLKLIPVMENWTKKGDALACVSCGRIIEELKKKDSSTATEKNNSSAADRLKNLLGDAEKFLPGLQTPDSPSLSLPLYEI